MFGVHVRIFVNLPSGLGGKGTKQDSNVDFNLS